MNIFGKLFDRARIRRGLPLCRMAIADSLEKMANVLETTEGRNGIVIRKTDWQTGIGWSIEYTGDASSAAPQLFDGRFDESGNLEIYCGANTSAIWVTETGGVTRYESPYQGWHAMGVSSGAVYLLQEGASMDLTTDNSPASTGQFKVPVGSAYEGVWYKTLFGPLAKPLPSGDAEHKYLVWDDTTQAWLAGAAADLPTPPDVTVDVTDGGSAASPVTVVTAAAVDETDHHKLKLTTKTITIPDVPAIPDGYEERANTLIDLQWDSSSHSFQKKTATVLVKTGTVSDWTNLKTFEPFDA